MRDFITIEERCAASITPVATTSLSDLVYSIVDTLKLRRQPLVKLRQADGEMFWVASDDLASNSICLNAHERPERYEHAQVSTYGDAAQPPEWPLLVVDSAEPTSLLMNVGVAAQVDIDRAPPAPPTLLVVTGAAACGKSTLLSALAASMPERVVFPNVVATGALPWADAVDIVAESDFAAHVAAGRFAYHAAAPQPSGFQRAVATGSSNSDVRWGVMKEEITELTAGKRGVYVALEEHPAGAIAAKAAEEKAIVVRVALPDVDTLDQRLRASRKQYEEQQVRSAPMRFLYCARQL